MPLLPDNFKAFGFKEATSDFFTPSNKVDELQRRRDEKLEGLASKATNSYTSHQLQQALSNAIDQQVYTDKLTGKKYQEKYTHDNLGNTVITKVPYIQKNTYGQEDLENLYIDTTKEGNYKLGLARPDKGFVGRYTKGTDGYGWAPGPKGVTPEDGALLDVTLPKNIAEELEYTIHSNKEQIRNRPYGTGAITPDIEKAYGSGKTEYTTPNAPLWNQDYNPMSVQGQITGNTKIPASPAEKAESKRRTAPGVESSFGESLLRAPQAAAAALTKSVYDMGDMAVELGSNLVARGAKALGASDSTVKYIDSIGLGSEKDKREVINDIFGYNDYYNQAAMKSTEEHYKKAVKDVDLFKPSTYKNIDMGEVANSFSAAFSSPEAAAASIGYLIPYLVGAPEKVAAKALSSEGKAAFKALKDTAQSTTISAADKANKMADIRNMMSTADKAKMVLINNANALSLGSTMTNEQLEEVIAKNGGEMPTLWKVGTMVALNSVGAKLDMKAATDIISGKPLMEGWATAIGELGEQGARKAAAKVAEYGTKLVGAGFEELGQEFVQSYFEAFNKTYGTDTTNIVEGTRRIGALEAALSPEVRTEAAVGAIAGAAGGIHMAMPRELYSAGKEVLAAPAGEFFKRDELEAPLAVEVDEADKPQQMSAEERINALEQAKAELLASGKTLTEEENQMFDEEIARLKSKVPWKTPKEALEALDKQDNGRRSQGYVYATKVVNTYKQTDVGPETPLDTALEIIKANNDLNAYYDEVGMKRPKKDRELATHNSAANKVKAALQQRIEQLGIQGLPEDEQFDALEAELDVWTKDKGPEAAAYKEALMGPMVELLLESKTFGSGPEASGIGNTFKIKIKGMEPTKETPSSGNIESAVGSDNPTTMKIKIKGAVAAPTKTEATVKVKEAVERKVKEADTLQVENIDTPTHSGVSARSIQKLAKVFGTSPKKVQSALDISFQKLLIKKMGTVSKEANEAQYNIYYGDDGILTNFVKYKKALQDSKTEDATKAWMRIVNRYVGQGYKGAVALKAIASYSEKIEARVKAGASLDDIKAEMKDVRVGVQGAKGGDIVGTLNGTDIIKLTDAVPEEMRNSIEFSKEGHVIEAAIESAQHIERMAEREGIALPEIKINQRDRAELRNKLVREAKEVQEQIDELEAISGDVFKEMSKEELKAHSELKNKVEKLKKQLAGKLKDITKQEKFAEVSEYQYNNVTFTEEADVSGKVGQSIGTVTAEEAERLGVDESMVEEFIPTKSSSEYKELIRELEALKKARAKLQTANQEVNKEEQTGKELYKKLQAELKEAAEVLGDATVAPVKSAITAATTADKVVRDLTNHIRKLKGDKKGLEKALEFLEKNEQAFEGITLDVVKLREVQKAFNVWLRKEGRNASVKAQNEKLRELAESRTVIEKIVKTADKIAKMGVVFARRLMGLLGNLGDKTLVGATKEGIAKIERLLEDAEKKLQTQKQAKTSAFKDAVKAVMDIRKQANMTGESLLNAEEIKRVLENASTVDKLRRRTYKNKELAKDKVRALTKLINEKEAELKGIALFKSQLGDNLEVIKDWKIEAKGKANSLDFKKLGKFGSILANLPIDAIKTLFDEKGVEAKLLSTIAGNTKGLVDKALYMNKAMPQSMLESVLAENPALMLLGKIEQDGERYKVTPNLEMLQALRLVAKNYLAVNESKLMYNDDLAISKIIGVSEYDWKAIKKARKALKEQGQLLTITASRIGDDFVRAMGISQGELGEEAYRKLVADLGNTALLMAEAANEVTYKRMGAESWNEIAGKKVEGQAEVLFIHVAKGQKNKRIKEESLALQQIDKTLQVLNRQSTYRTHPIFAVQNEKDDYTIDGSPFGVPEKSKAVLRVLEDQEYKINVPALDAMLEMYAKDKEAFMGRSGWKKLPEDALQDDVDAQESKNREIEDTMEKLAEMMQAYKNGELSDGVFFNWFFSSNGRYMIDAVGVNLQADKHVTRWVLLPKEAHDVEWNLADKNAQKLMYDGIAQAFGWDIDKKHPDETKAFAEKIIEEFNKDPKAFETKVRNGDNSLEMPHVGHAFIAVEFMKNMKGKKRFRGTLVAEYDAKTSGPMHKLMQWPILQDEEGKDITAEWFNKGAIILDGNELKNGSSAAHIQNTVDGYQTVTLGAVAAISEGIPTASKYADYTQVFGKLDTLTKPLVNAATGAVEEAGRKLGKQAFVPFGYGSSTKTIQDNVGMTLAYDLLRRIAAANDEEAKKVVMDTFGMSDATYKKLQEALRTTPTDEIRLSDFGLKKDTLFKTKEITVIGMLSEMFSMTYGEAYKQAMESKFSKHVTINNTIKDVTSVMFRVWKARYDKEIAKKPNAAAKEKMEIIRELEEAFPLIRAPWSENRLDGVAIFETKRASMKNEIMPTVRTVKTAEDGGMTSRSVQAMITEMEEVFAAGAVLPIHWIDGSQIGTILAEGGVQGVHDAIVLGIPTKEGVGRISRMNKAMYDVNANYNLLGEFQFAFTRMLAGMSNEEIDAFVEGEANKEKDGLSLARVKETLDTLTEEVNKAREKLYSRPMTVGNIIAFEGTEYNNVEDLGGYKDLDATIDELLEGCK